MNYYYCDYPKHERVDGSSPLDATLEEILERWESLSRRAGCFLGVVCSNGQSLQFMWDNETTVVLDIPVPEKRGSLTKSSTYEECRQALIDVFSGTDPTTMDGLEFFGHGQSG